MPGGFDVFIFIDELIPQSTIDIMLIKEIVEGIKADGDYDVLGAASGDPEYINNFFRNLTAKANFTVSDQTVDTLGLVFGLITNASKLTTGDLYKMFDSDDYIPDYLKGLFSRTEVETEWQDIKQKYNDAIIKMRESTSPLTKVNMRLSKYQIASLAGALYLIFFSLFFVALLSQLLSCTKMLQRDPGNARCKICCAPAGQICMVLTLSFMGLFAMLFCVILSALGLADNIPRAWKQAMPLAAKDDTELQEITATAFQSINSALIGTGLGISLSGLSLDFAQTLRDLELTVSINLDDNS